jgi:hypothetical protein
MLKLEDGVRIEKKKILKIPISKQVNPSPKKDGQHLTQTERE